MIGLNGGLIGARRVPSPSASSGIWNLREQILARRASIWPSTNIYSIYLVAALPGQTSGGTFAAAPNNDPARGFDGNTGTGVGCVNGSTLLFTPQVPIPFNTTLQIDGMESGFDSVVLNGTTTVTSSGGTATFSGPGSIITLRIQDRPPSYFAAGFTRIRVDGVAIVDGMPLPGL